MATAYSPRLKDRYSELRPQLQEELALKSIMQVPEIEKITLNMGVGDAKTDAKALDSAIEELSIIAAQRAQVRKARKSIASFKLREGMAVGAKVTPMFSVIFSISGTCMIDFRPSSSWSCGRSSE